MKPLDGIRVLSLATQYPGPFATMVLADLGADVVIVERPGFGDPGRRNPDLFATLNRGKRSLAMDLKTEKDKNALLRLADKADEPVCHLAVGVLNSASKWATGGENLRIKAVECIAAGGKEGVILIEKPSG